MEPAEGRIVHFCRVNPHDGALAEAERCLDLGAHGIKLHPRAEQFAMSEPAVEDLTRLAQERGVPILIHAGRGIPALGHDTLELAERYPGARFILAHAAVSDLAWLWRLLPEHPNLFVDSSWWNPADFVALFSLVPPGQILWASDNPYGQPLSAAAFQLRYALLVGLDGDQIRTIAGGQIERILGGEEPLDLDALGLRTGGQFVALNRVALRQPGPVHEPGHVQQDSAADDLVLLIGDVVALGTGAGHVLRAVPVVHLAVVDDVRERVPLSGALQRHVDRVVCVAVEHVILSAGDDVAAVLKHRV